ncbi:hypothetical protein GI374_11590 [Paracoccus sp. S-4012]|uniref:hypothetical protein n=1 Tax=Paracoccus sp. S-4012 TaxID=2665648 RepID=UPI0012B0F89B|nr:hypothetical protein [Paracoccus sp. S-4012]MRX51079.1 hypothetical protein [Paracoccus sp. S-4012]
MSAPYHPSSVAARVTRPHKVAVWAAIAPPARLDIGGIARATGIDFAIVAEVVAGNGAGKLVIHDAVRPGVWIRRAEVPA